MSLVVASDGLHVRDASSIASHGLSGRPAGRCAVAVAAVRVRPGPDPAGDCSFAKEAPGEANVPPDTPRIRQRHHPTKAPLFGASLAPLLTDPRALEHRNQSIDTP